MESLDAMMGKWRQGIKQQDALLEIA